MKRISKLFILVCFIICITGSAFSQDDSIVVNSISVAAKIYAGGLIFPSPSLSYPSPMGGIGFSVFIKSFELEAGTYYYRKFDRIPEPDVGKLPGPHPPYHPISYVQDYLNFYLAGNIKIAQYKKNLFSAYVGVLLRKNVSWSSDTLMDDGTHRSNKNITTKANRSIGISVIAGLRYTRICSDHINLIVGADLGASFENEYDVPNGPQTTQSMAQYPKPIEPAFQMGLSVGVQFMLSKRRTAFFYGNKGN
jgi:hypothetical protein